MRVQTAAVVASSLIGFAFSAPLNSTTNSTSTTTPCGKLTAGYVQFYSNDSNSERAYLIPASAALECLESSAIDGERAAAWVVEVKKYVEFQSTIAYLKNPPSDYWYPAVDLLGSFDDLASKASSGTFTSQYEFDKAIQSLVSSVHDGHFNIHTCTFGSILYLRGLPKLQLVSVSSDGIAIPSVYLLDDVHAAQSNYTTSSVASINGESVVDVLEACALNEDFDLDASYNFVFWSYAEAAGAPSGNGDGVYTFPNTYLYPGDYTNITFANGTTKSFTNHAFIQPGNWDSSIVDGASFTKFFCMDPTQLSEEEPSNATATSPLVSTATPAAAPTIVGYPYYPVAKDPNNQIAGYFLNNTGYQDTAVLFIPSFAIEAPSAFQDTTRNFFAAARAGNKTKLIIDVSGNGGGNVLVPNDVFKHLFPDIEPYGASRLRINPAANIYGTIYGAIPDSELQITSKDAQEVALLKASLTFSSPWQYRSQLTVDLQNFTSWSNSDRPFFPPNQNNGDKFTALSRLPANSTWYDRITDGIIPYGYANQPKNPQPFSVENIVLVTDGICSSACSTFAEFLTRQASVKTIVVGGRPQYAPAQAIGGVKGSLVYNAVQLQRESETISRLFADSILPLIPESLNSTLADTLPGLVPLALGRSTPTELERYSVNLRDNIPEGDTHGVPLQFVFEPADCRIFYTKESVVDPLALWLQAADVAFKGKSCAYGGISGPVINNGTRVGKAAGSGSGKVLMERQD